MIDVAIWSGLIRSDVGEFCDCSVRSASQSLSIKAVRCFEIRDEIFFSFAPDMLLSMALNLLASGFEVMRRGVV